MKTTLKNKVAIRFIQFIALVGPLNLSAQIPNDFLTKVSYLEKKEVSFSLPNGIDQKCLTLSELSRYHGYMQFYSIDEYIDIEGDLLTDKKFIEELNVRDQWMESYDRIIVGKKSVQIFGKKSGLMHEKVREQDSEISPITPELAAKYGYYNFDLNLFSQLESELVSAGYGIDKNNIFIIAKSKNRTIQIDKLNKVFSVTEFDSAGIKISETVTQFVLSHSEDTYFPETETKTEWLIGENGCCIRKQTVTSKYEYSRSFGLAQNQNLPGKKIILEDGQNKGVEILSEINSNIFRIKADSKISDEYSVLVYDMTGKILLETQATQNEPIVLPASVRCGVYLVHVYSKNDKNPIVGKIIKSANTNNF